MICPNGRFPGYFFLDKKVYNFAQAECRAEFTRALLRRSKISETKKSRPFPSRRKATWGRSHMMVLQDYLVVFQNGF